MIYLTSSSARISSSSILSVSENVRVLAVFLLLLSVSVSAVSMVTPLRWAGVLRPLLSSASAAAARAAALASRTWRCFRTWRKLGQQKCEGKEGKLSNIKGERCYNFFLVPSSDWDTICTVKCQNQTSLRER